MKPYTFEIQAEIVALMPGTLTVHASSFEEAVRLATHPEAWVRARLDYSWVRFGTPASLDFESVSEGGDSEPVEFCWSTLDGPIDDDHLAAVREADQAEVSA